MPLRKLLIVGGGSLCLQVLQALVPRNGFEFHVASRNHQKTHRLCNLVRMAALQQTIDLSIKSWEMDLTIARVERNYELLKRIKPDIILNCASLQSWQDFTQVPDIRLDALNQAHAGAWLPLHLAPAYALMRAVKKYGHRVLTINAAFPDIVNAVLFKVGMAPDVGVGSIANLVPATRCAIAYLEGCDPNDVRVKLIGQHSFSRSDLGEGLPCAEHFHLSYWVKNQEMTDHFSTEEILGTVADSFQCSGGVNEQYLTAMSAVSIMENIFMDHEFQMHAPGPHGLPGGYPVKIGMDQVLLGLPYGIRREEAISINELRLRHEGIEAIHADGSVSFTGEQTKVMDALLGFDMPHLQVQDAERRASELTRKYKAFVQSAQALGA